MKLEEEAAGSAPCTGSCPHSTRVCIGWLCATGTHGQNTQGNCSIKVCPGWAIAQDRPHWGVTWTYTLGNVLLLCLEMSRGIWVKVIDSVEGHRYGQTWAALCRSHEVSTEKMSCGLAWHQAWSEPAPQPCAWTAPALPQRCRQAEHLHNVEHFMFPAENLCVTPQTQHTTRYWIAKAACDSRAGLRLKAEEECTWKTFLFATQCDQKHIYNCFKLFTRQSNNWHSCFLLPPVKLPFFLFAISTFWLFWWNTFCHIALLSPLLCLKI